MGDPATVEPVRPRRPLNEAAHKLGHWPVRPEARKERAPSAAMRAATDDERDVVAHAGKAVLALGALGIVYGDIGTSPLYTEQFIFTAHRQAATPDQFIAGLTDFGPGRKELFENSADDDLKVHDKGPTDADVTEGSSGIWERLHYDWSNPSHVVLTTTDSNAWANGPSHTYDLKQGPDGTTDIDYTVVREGKNLKGRLLGVVLGTVGKGKLSKAAKVALGKLEAVNVPVVVQNTDAKSYGVGVDGLLGMSFLARFDVQMAGGFVEVDPPEGLLEL